jgi:hypothetical protein
MSKCLITLPPAELTIRVEHLEGVALTNIGLGSKGSSLFANYEETQFYSFDLYFVLLGKRPL